MTKPELAKAFEIAKSDQDLTHEDIDLFDGFGLPDFQKVTCTLRQVAGLIRWQAQYMTGGWDMSAINEIRTCGRSRFMVIG